MLRAMLGGELDSRFVKLFLIGNWILTGLLGLVAALFSTPQLAIGILTGGIIANLNCMGLNRDCQRVTRWRNRIAYAGGLIVRLGLIALAVLVALLIFPQYVSQVGLFVGLSVAVLNFYFWVLAMVIYRVRVKEAV
jgi:hypothetical protein